MRATTALLLAGCLALNACSSSSGPDGDDDGQAPSPITDLAVLDFTVNSVTLTWTAPGDDGDVGTATRYEVRGSLDFIHPGNWADAIVAPDAPTPGPAGTVETMTIVGLEEDEHYFFAVRAFDEAGNSPGCSNCVDVTCFDNTAVVFADPAIEAAVRAVLSLPDGPLLRSRVREVVELQVESEGVADLGGLEFCAALAFVKMRGNAIVDLGPLANLTALFDVDLRENAIVDLTPLAALPNLRHLQLDDNQIADVSPLAGLVGLEILYLARNQFVDIGPLASLTSLLSLRLDGNGVADLGPLVAMTALESLAVQQAAVSSLVPLAGMMSLGVLLAGNNSLGSLEGLAGLSALTLVVVNQNQVTDLQPLVDNAGFGEGDVLYVMGNPLSGEAVSVQVPVLVGRGVGVYY